MTEPRRADHHVATRPHPRPSGWRAECSCGETVRGYDEADVLAQFLTHCEAQHLAALLGPEAKQ